MSPELLAAVKERLDLGYSHEAIKDELYAAGHDEATAEQVLQQALAETHNASSEIPAAPATAAAPGTEQSGQSAQLIGYSDLLSQSWGLLTRQIPLFAKAIGLFVILFISMGLLLGGLVFSALDSFVEPVSWMAVGAELSLGLLLVFFLGFILVGLGIRIVSFSVVRNLAVRQTASESYLTSLKWSALHIIPIIVLSVMVYFATQLGYVLLLLPGIALAIYLMFTSYVLAREEGRYLSAMVRSTELVYGRWWSVFGRIVVAVLVVGVIMVGVVLAGGLITGVLTAALGSELVASLIGLVLMPVLMGGVIGYLMCVSILLMESLVATKQPEAITASGKKKLRTFYLVAVILGFVAWVFVQGISSNFEDALDMPGDGENATLKLALNNARPAAELYRFSEGGETYEGVCTEIEPLVAGASKYSDCVASVDAWALSGTSAATDEQFCTDSGSGVVRGGIDYDAVACVNEPITDVDTNSAKERASELRQMDGAPTADGQLIDDSERAAVPNLSASLLAAKTLAEQRFERTGTYEGTCDEIKTLEEGDIEFINCVESTTFWAVTGESATAPGRFCIDVESREAIDGYLRPGAESCIPNTNESEEAGQPTAMP